MAANWVWALALVPLGTLSACSDRFGVGDCKAERTCVASDGGAGGEEAVDGGVSEIAGASGNNANGGDGSGACNGDVSDDPDCWTSNEHGVFVSNQTGDDDTGDGTREAPYASIGKGLTRAAGKKVFVCLSSSALDYEEDLVIDAELDGAAIYGGFECEGWTYSADRKASLVSTTSVGLRVSDLKVGLHIENLRISARDAKGKALAASSYGVFATGSTGVQLRNVDIAAGAGAKGQDGDKGATGANGEESGSAQSGFDAICQPLSVDPAPSIRGGEWSSKSACGSLGGAGGTGRTVHPKATASGASGEAGSPIVGVADPAQIENGGDGETAANQDLDGDAGANGSDGNLGVAAPAFGLFSKDGFNTADGRSGTDGAPGQGGGGGGASRGTTNCYGASGGAGGMGGCGGRAGTGGGGGGASIGLFAWDAQVVLDGCRLVASSGGRGGSGGAGGASGLGATGGVGGQPLPGSSISRGGLGGLGGDGGQGGSGAGGSGGPSVAIVWHGSRPGYDAASTFLVTASGGLPGVGGSRGEMAPSGSAGRAQAELNVK